MAPIFRSGRLGIFFVQNSAGSEWPEQKIRSEQAVIMATSYCVLRMGASVTASMESILHENIPLQKQSGDHRELRSFSSTNCPFRRLRRSRFTVMWWLVGLLGMPLALWGQSNVRLMGRVSEAGSGAPIAGAVVQIAHTSFGALTDEEGRYAVENLPPGRYTVIFSALSYASRTVEGVSISQDTPRQLSVTLTPAPLPGKPVQVTVTAARELPDVEGDRVVLTAETVAQFAGLGVANLLQQVAGVQVETTGGGKSRAILRIHGSRGSQVLVLLDGQRLNNPQTGEVNLQEIPLEQVERIEVIRQANTALYGGSAFGGVIKITTRRASRGPALRVQAEGGSFASASGGLGGDIIRGGFGLVGHYSQDYSRQNFPYHHRGERERRENAWYRHRTLFVKIHRETPHHQVRVQYHRQHGVQGLPSAFFEEMNPFGAFAEGTTEARQAQYRWVPGRRGYVQFQYGEHRLRERYQNERDPSPFTRYHVVQINQVREAQLSGTWLWGGHLETRLGLNWLEEQLNQENRLFPSLSMGKKIRHTRSAYGSLEYRPAFLEPTVGRVSLYTAWRYEAYFDQPGEWYPLVGFTVAPRRLPRLYVSLNWTRAVRYPDFNSLFWKGDARARGNPDLLPEKKREWNLSLGYRPRRPYLPELRVHHYRADIRDLIFWHRTVQGFWEPRNEVQAQKQGWDVEAAQTLLRERLRWRVAYSFIDAINKSPEPNRFNKRIVFIPRHTVNASLTLRVGGWQVIGEYRFLSEREMLPANPAEKQLPAYSLWNAYFSYRRRLGHWQVQGGLALHNLTGTSYQLLRGYPMPEGEYRFSVQFTYQP